MNNACRFSPCRRYRYSLVHEWDELVSDRRQIMWIGLNPSTADEFKLDNTLRRIRSFSTAWGFNSFVMTNLFAFRATKPSDMKRESDPVGPENDAVLCETAAQSSMIVAAWGTHGTHRGRDVQVWQMLRTVTQREIHCLMRNDDATRTPRHPLFVDGTTTPILFTLP